jgi:hypothetical protein
MPIPPIEAQTEWFEAGVVRIGVEYRLLTGAITAASTLEDAGGGDASDARSFDDRGVSIHVCGRQGDSWLEFVRFDCFVEDPHYHYVSWSERSNEMLHIDPVADGDPAHWALERIRTRLAPMLERAGAADVAARLEPAEIEAVLPRVTEAAYRARYHHDAEAILASALGSGR